MSLPNAPSGAQGVVPSPEVWDRIVELLQRVENISVAPPLTLTITPTGIVIGATDIGEFRVLKRTTQISSQQGRYNARTMQQGKVVANAAASGAVTASDFGTANTADDSILWEVDPADGYVFAQRIGFDSASRKGIFLIPRTGTFPVKIAKDGGAQGTQTAAATWTYTVKTLAGDTIKATVPLTRPRPVGTATVQADDSYGLAFYAGGDIKLWDAGEIYGAAPCPP
jgi:hypothetical protein